jgi:hypothetical protein
MIHDDGLSGYVVGCVAIAAAFLLARIVLFLWDRRKPHSSNVAKEARESGANPQWPAPPDDDPLHIPPDAIELILFADGFRILPTTIYERGLLPVVDETGHVVMVMDPKRNTTKTIAEWCGVDHGVRIS